MTKIARENIRRRTIMGGFCRKRYIKWRFEYVAIGFVFMFASTFGIAGDDLSTSVDGTESVGVKENFWKAFNNADEDSDSLPENHFQSKMRTRLGIADTLISKTNIDRLETSKLVEGGELDEERNEISHWGDGAELFERGNSLRKLDSDSNETGEDTGVPVNTNSTMIEILEIEFSRAIVILTTLLGVMAVLLSVLSCIFVYLYRNNNLVAIGQPPFLYLICFGSLLLSSELFFLFRYSIAEQSTCDATCVAQLWFRNIGSICVHMAVFCKLWRAYKVAQFRKNQIVLPKHVIGPFVVMMGAVIALTSTQTIIDPPVWRVRNVTGLDHIGMCLPSTADASSIHRKNLWLDITTAFLQFLSLVIMLVMAYITRNIPEDISDSRHVFHAVITNILLMALTYALFWIGAGVDNYALTSISRSLRYFFDAIVFVIYLVVPKIYVVWLEKRNTTSNGTTIALASETPSRGKGRVTVGGLDSA